MDTPHPPFNQVIPRQLNRWLDVNPQGGPLQRTMAYLDTPTFNVTPEAWHGYSEIVETFNYASTRAFILTDLGVSPLSVNYVLFIAYEQGGVVYRYRLAGSDGTFYFQIVDYTNQPIKNNFRFEVWSISAAPVTETAGWRMLTSAQGNQDYRYGADFSIASVQSTVLDFQSINATVDLPFVEDLVFGFRADSGYSASAGTWNSRFADANQITSNATPAQAPATDSHLNGHTYIPITQTNPWVCTLNNSQDCYNLFIVFRAELTASSGAALRVMNGGSGGTRVFEMRLGASTAPSTNPTNLTGANDIGLYSVISTQLSNGFYLVEIRSGLLFQYGLNDSAPKNTGTGSDNNIVTIDTIQIAPSRGLDLAEVWAYGTQQNFNAPTDYYQLFQYISDRYGVGRIPLPFTFPANSSVPSN